MFWFLDNSLNDDVFLKLTSSYDEYVNFCKLAFLTLMGKTLHLLFSLSSEAPEQNEFKVYLNKEQSLESFRVEAVFKNLGN